MTTRPRYSPAEIEYLRTAEAAGMSVKAMASRLGRSPNAITQMRRKCKLTRRGPATPELTSVSLRNVGLTMGKLVDELTPEQQARVIALAKSRGLTAAGAIARLLG